MKQIIYRLHQGVWPPISSFALDLSLTKFFGVQLHVPPPPHCTDNGVMIALARTEGTGYGAIRAVGAGGLDEGDGCVLGREGAVSD